MNKFFYASLITLSLVACKSATQGDKVETSEAVTPAANAEGAQFSVDTSSTLMWTGSKPTGSHTGSIKISEGTFIADTSLTGGNFTIDMNSLVNHDLEGDADSKGKLEGHLKSADFFDTQKYPTAKFVITEVAPIAADATSAVPDATHKVTGNLTVKDSTKSISFPAKVNVTDNQITALADFNIDRTEFGVNYKGPNNPQDWVISKAINFKLNLTANKK